MTRAVWAVVPVKEIAAAKERLAGALPRAIRQALALAMLEDVMAALAATRDLAGILVVTVEPQAARIAARYGASACADGARDGHSGAVAGAARFLAAQGAAMLTLPGDVPLVRPGDIQRVLDARRGDRGFAIVPARDARGSNAILCAPADAVPLRFGEDSYVPHLAAARARGIEPVSLAIPRLALDIDRPDDLVELLKAPDRCRAQVVLERHGVSASSLAAGAVP
jgi:2-phospho-L-lactate guanylyltransferase